MIRLAAVDDSALVREFLSAALKSQPDIELVAMGSNGAEAIDIVRKHKPHVLVLDLEMPGMGGLDVLRTVMPEHPLRVLVYTTHGAKSVATFQALRLGALGFLDKPENLMDPGQADTAKGKLLERIREVAAAVLRVVPHDPTVAPRGKPALDCPFGAIVVAATAGGTAPILPLLRALPSTMPVPVFLFPQINTAMGAGFAEWLNSEVSVKVAFAGDGTPIAPGTVYITPIGRGFEIRDGVWKALPEHASDPGAGGLDATLTHLASAYGGKVLAILLSGTGIDGVEGLSAVKRAGGIVVVLDPVTAFTPDLPATAIRHGLASEVVPLARVGTRTLELCNIRR